MNVIVCLDDMDGMMFNHRRQSRDRMLLADVIQRCGEKPVFVSQYTAQLFADYENKIVSDDFPGQAQDDDFWFVEDQPVLPVEDSVGRLIIYRWNRRYPSDRFFDIPLTDHGWKLESTADFEGSSHEKITREEYVR